MTYRIYGLSRSVACRQTVELLDDLCLPYTFINLDNDKDIQDKIQKETGIFTMPVIFGKDFVGGYEELKKLLSQQ